MHLVPITPTGEIKWKDLFEVESIESYAEEANQLLRKSAVPHHRYYIVSERRIDYLDGESKLIMSYHACTDTKPYRLV